jgi:ankyrin repeat protein
LVISLRFNYTEPAHVLIKAGANVNHAGPGFHTPLHWAAKWGSTSIINALVKAGAHVNHPEHPQSHTPLHLAAIEGHKDAARALLDHGADPHLKDGHGFNAHKHSQRNGAFEKIEHWTGEL